MDRKDGTIWVCTVWSGNECREVVIKASDKDAKDWWDAKTKEAVKTSEQRRVGIQEWGRNAFGQLIDDSAPRRGW